jgi:hypothetical protein
LTGSQLSRISWVCCSAFSQERVYLEGATYVIDLEVVARDGIEPPTPAFSGQVLREV